jgi:hypothetical protein
MRTPESGLQRVRGGGGLYIARGRPGLQREGEREEEREREKEIAPAIAGLARQTKSRASSRISKAIIV